MCGCAVWEGTRHARCCLAASQHVTHSLGVVRQVPYVLAVGAAPGRGRGGGGGPPPLRSTTAPVTDVCRSDADGLRRRGVADAAPAEPMDAVVRGRGLSDAT